MSTISSRLNVADRRVEGNILLISTTAQTIGVNRMDDNNQWDPKKQIIS